MSNEPENTSQNEATPGTPTPEPSPAPIPAPTPAPGGGQIPGAEKKMVSGILAILLGSLGIHKFYLGYTKEGIIQLVVAIVLTVVTCGFGAIVPWGVGIAEGIIYLTKTDDEFVKTYVTGRRPWF